MNNLPDLPEYVYRVKRLVINKDVSKWCQSPYPRHPNGCPKYNKDSKCPPQCGSVFNYFNTALPLYLVHSEFNLSKHISRMKLKYPKWSPAQCSCVLYWQGSSRKQLKNRVQEASLLLGTDAVSFIPEALGVNVYVTARLSGLILERIRHLSICRHVALIGSSIKPVEPNNVLTHYFSNYRR